MCLVSVGLKAAAPPLYASRCMNVSSKCSPNTTPPQLVSVGLKVMNVSSKCWPQGAALMNVSSKCWLTSTVCMCLASVGLKVQL